MGTPILAILLMVSSLTFGQENEIFKSTEHTVLVETKLENLFKSVIKEAILIVKNGEEPTLPNGTSAFPPSQRNETGRGRPSHHNYCKFTSQTEKIGRISNENIFAYDIFLRIYPQVPKKQVLSLLTNRLPRICMDSSRRKCSSRSKYRTIDGSCNNLWNPSWGASFTGFQRLSPAAYKDGWNEPRGSSNGEALPNPRHISVNAHPDKIDPDTRITNMVPQFGQFLDHDMTLTPESDKRCCTTESGNVDCLNIGIAADDYFYSNLSSPQRCMDFTRSTPFCFPTTPEGLREQMNILTAFVDASQVYGSENSFAKLLRAYEGGRLSASSNNSQFLPTVQQRRDATGEKIEEFMGTFLAGDIRVNEMPGLTVMHTLLFREHNRLADQILILRPKWNDERIFQEARKILIAEWQNAVYGEYLPLILGDTAMVKYGLKLDDQQLITQYDPFKNPTIFHAFADAAYRFGHTLINGLVRMLRNFEEEVNKYQIRDHFFNDEQISFNEGEGYNLILGGLMAQNAQTFDRFITEDVTNFLLKEKEHDFGSDLIARNLQRGREHGLPGYSAYREICNLSALTSWEDRPIEIPKGYWTILQSLYTSPMDIDLFTGGIGEVPVSDGISGATFNCLKSKQFALAKFGDRFFFTHSGQAGSFTTQQVQEIRKRTFGDIICSNSGLDVTTRNVFLLPSADNPMISCKNPSRSNLNLELLLPRR